MSGSGAGGGKDRRYRRSHPQRGKRGRRGPFLEGKIGFLDIADRVRRAMEQVKVIQDPSMTQVLEADAAAREAVLSL